MTPRELDAALWSSWFGHKVWGAEIGQPFYATDNWDGVPVPELSTTWTGFGLLMEEAERRGWRDVSFITWDDSVMCTLTHKYGTQVRSDVATDKLSALAYACEKVIGLEV